MASKAVADTGPILHLFEIDRLKLLNLFNKLVISTIIQEELSVYAIEMLPKNTEIKEINKDQVRLLAEKYDLALGESSALWLCKSLQIPLLLTDDLNAREVASALEIKPLGTLGIIIRNYREKKINQTEAILLLQSLHQNSSLFITSGLIAYAIAEIKKFRAK